MAVTANFSKIPNIGRARISGNLAPNTARDGSGTEGTDIFNCFTAGSGDGSRIDRVIINAAGTLAATTAGMIRFFISESSGANKRLWREWAVTAVTPSASAIGYTNYTTSLIDGGLKLKAGEKLWCTSHIADTAGNQFDIIIEGGDFL